MINRQDLLELQSIQSNPALSILLPTHRTSPDNKQDPILVKNLIDQAKVRLSEEFSQRELSPLLQNLEDLVNQIDYPHTLDGLALFVSHDFTKLYNLPFTVPARVVIDKTFATRDLVYGMHRAQRYWVLLLSQSFTRLLAGTGETLEEVSDRIFPMQMRDPRTTGPLSGGMGFDRSSYMDDMNRQFYRQVDIALLEYTKHDPLPIVVGGVDRQASFFNEVSQQSQLIAGTLSGNFDKVPIHELTPQAWSIVQTVRANQREQALQELDQAMGAQLVVSMIEEVWRLAREGRGKLLLTEKNFHIPAVLTDAGQLKLVDEVGGVDIMDDAVDEIIEAVLAKGGEVVFVEDGALAVYQRVAMILRY